MMPRRFALRDKPLPHMDGKRQIRQSVAMQVAKFPAAHPKLDPSEPVCGDRDTGPAGHLPDDLVFDALGHVPRRYQYLPAGLASIRLAHLRVHSADPCISGDDANCAPALDPFRS
jgi:hypothetical protein